MNPFRYQRVSTPEGAILAITSPGARFLAGGTNLVDLMKDNVEKPTTLVDIGHLNLKSITMSANGTTMIEAGVSNSAIANHEIIRTHYPLVSHSILSGATTQLRNMATAGGNLVQRTRCPYFMEANFSECNKRNPGSGCAAISGFHREHAIFGASEYCVAIHPSDMAVALVALDAVVYVQGPSGKRTIPIEDFHRLPGATPEIDNNLRPDELILGIELPKSKLANNSWYLKVRDRHSYAFALVSVAAGLELEDGRIRSSAIALGGVASKPWRSREAEEVLTGTQPGVEVFREAAEVALRGAKALEQNAFKIDLAKHSIVRSLTLAAERRDA